MENRKPAFLAASFQSADIPRGFGAPAPQNECPKLAYLWDRTVAVKKEASGKLICLRVSSMNRPITLLEGDGWLGCVTAVRKNHWDVTVWREQLSLSRLFSDPADRKAAMEMLHMTRDLAPSAWTWPALSAMLRPE
jgi:hypothetical protein